MVEKMDSKIFEFLNLDQNYIADLVRHHYAIMPQAIQLKNCFSLDSFTDSIRELDEELHDLGTIRSELIDLSRLLHLPVSLRDVFLLNYLSSHLSLK